jgi:hypothetical protein
MPRGETLVKDAVIHLDDFAISLIDQESVAAVAHPDGAGRRRRQAVVIIIADPVTLRPEQGGQGFAEGPAM